MHKSALKSTAQFEAFRKKKEEEGNAPTLIMAARAFKRTMGEEKNLVQNHQEQEHERLENEMDELKQQMDKKMYVLKDEAIDETKADTGPGAEILESVMSELEQRNMELQSLLSASEISREKLGENLKEQNEELATLRANSIVVRQLEDEVSSLNQKRNEMNNEILALEAEINEHRRSEKNFVSRIEECERQKGTMDKDHRNQLMDMASRVRNVEEMIVEKDQELENAESGIKELMFKCEQFGASNEEIKKELDSSLESGKRLLEVNAKLQFCKQYLEQQVDQLVKDLKAQCGENETIKLKIANLTREKTTSEKQQSLMAQTEKNMQQELQTLNENVATQQKQLEAYENGAIRSQVVTNEINTLKRSFKEEKSQYTKKSQRLDDHIKHLTAELKESVRQVQELYEQLSEKQSKLDYYQENYIEKAELTKLRTDLELKYKLDLNTQLQRITHMYEQEQSELVETMKSSMRSRVSMNSDDLKIPATMRGQFDV